MSAACAIATCVAIGPRLVAAAAVVVRTRGDVRDDRWLVAQEFSRLGVAPATPVAAIDYQSQRENWSAAVISDWARLAHVRVVGEVTQPQDDAVSFWRLPRERQLAALSALRSTGARIVVASGVPAQVDTAGWTQIARSQYYYRNLE